MTVVHDYIATAIATLSRSVPAPVAPFGFGVDLKCVTDVTERLDEVDPDSTQGLAESQVRRLSTARGLIPDLPNDGLDLRAFLNHGTTAADLVALRGRIQNECAKDDRIARVVTTVTFPTPQRMVVSNRNTPKDPNLNEFTATFAVESGAVTLEALS